MSTPWQVVIASSDPDQLRRLSEILEQQELEPICTSTVMECRNVLAKETVGLVFCDRKLADGNYSDLIAAGRSVNSRARFVVTSPQADWNEFLEATRFGAFDVITAPCRPKDVEWMIIQARRDDLKMENSAVNEFKASVTMHVNRTYDIFRRTANKDAVWLEAVQGLDQAKKRLLHHRSTSTEEILVFDVTEAKFIDMSDKAESA